MRYLKSNLFDISQRPMIIYRLVEYEQTLELTIEKNIILLVEDKTGEQETSRKENGDFEDEWASHLLTQKFDESSEKEYLKDTDSFNITIK